MRPAWAVGCAGNLEGFPILPGIEVLTILVDHDLVVAVRKPPKGARNAGVPPASRSSGSCQAIAAPISTMR